MAKKLIDEAKALPASKRRSWPAGVDASLRSQLDELLDAWEAGQLRQQLPTENQLKKWVGKKFGVSVFTIARYIQERRDAATR